MKQIRRAAPVLCTLLLLGVGLYMPQLASMSLKLHLQSEVRQMKNSDISLNLSQEADILESLSLFNTLSSAWDSAIELSESSQGYRLHAEEVRSAATEALGQIKSDGAVYGEPEITPILYVGTNDRSLQSRVFWCCSWVGGSEGAEIIWVDDLSGQVVGFILEDPVPNMASTYSKGKTTQIKEYVPESVYLLKDFCHRYYPVDEVIIKNEGDNTFALILSQRRNGVEISIPVFVSWKNGRIFFNC